MHLRVLCNAAPTLSGWKGLAWPEVFKGEGFDFGEAGTVDPAQPEAEAVQDVPASVMLHMTAHGQGLLLAEESRWSGTKLYLANSQRVRPVENPAPHGVSRRLSPFALRARRRSPQKRRKSPQNAAQIQKREVAINSQVTLICAVRVAAM